MHTMMLITKHTHSPRLQHHGQAHLQLILDPALSKRPQDMSMSNDDDVLGASSLRAATGLEERRLQQLDLLDDAIQPLRDLRGALALLAAVMPDVPLGIGIQAARFPAVADLRRQQALVQAVFPLADVLGDLGPLVALQLRAAAGVEEDVEGLLGARARRDEDFG